jgi:hypothetical protein
LMGRFKNGFTAVCKKVDSTRDLSWIRK